MTQAGGLTGDEAGRQTGGEAAGKAAEGAALPEPEYRIDSRNLREVPVDPAAAEEWLAATSGDEAVVAARIAWLRIMGRLPEAEAAARAALEAASPASLSPHTRAGSALVPAGILPAIRLAQVLQWKGQHGDALSLLAAVDRVLARLASASADAAQGTRAFLHQHRGKVLLDAGHPVWALSEFRRALQLRIAAGSPDDQRQSAETAVREALRRLK